MKRPPAQPLILLLLALSPLESYGAPPPYWPPYPPSPYYPVTPPPSAPTVTATEELPEEKGVDNNLTELNTEAEAEQEPPFPEHDSAAEENLQQPSSDTHGSSDLSESDTTPDDDWELAREISAAIQQGNFAEAYYLWRPRAEAGNADAQYGIGWMYHNGYGLAINDDEASAWWELASRQGHTDATFALGMLYGLGEGPVRRDMPRAVSYYHQAALNGHEDAKLLLRTLMAEGDESASRLMQNLLEDGRVGEITLPASVVSNKANVRRGPNTQHKVLITLKQGHPLMPLKREGRWLLVGIKGKNYSGWIHDSLVGKDILTAPLN